MNKEKIKGLLHLAAGVIVLFHGFDSFERAEIIPAAAYLSFALLYMLVAAMHSSIIRRFLQADTAFFLLEAITILYSAWHYKIYRNTTVYVLLGMAGIIYLIISLLSINDIPKSRRSRRRKRKVRPHQLGENL